MNVYDFDGTIYPGDCAVSFGFWCLNRHPKLWITFFPKAVGLLIQYKTGKIKKFELLRDLFEYLKVTDDAEEQIERFWDKNEHKIAHWYLAQKQPDDLIISEDPSLVIKPIAGRLGVNFMATEYDHELGVLVDNLMYAQEKARYIADHGFPKIDNFYSDSLADTPLALCSEKAFLVTDNASRIRDWPELDEETKAKVRKEINTGWTHLD